jgi:hypothetical protein
MQLSRVVIAAVFFAIGALIAIPALTRTGSPSASGTPTPTGAVTASGTPTGTPSRTPTGTPGRTPPTRTPSARTSPTRTPSAAAPPSRTPTVTSVPTRSAPSPALSTTRSSARPSAVRPPGLPSTRPTVTPSLPTTRPTVTPSLPIRAPIRTATPATRLLTARIGAVHCPARTVTVTVTSTSIQTEDYAVEVDGAAVVAGRIPPRESRTASVTLREDDRTTVAATWRNEPVRSAVRTADCRHHTSPPKSLPHTGADDGILTARIATGIAAMITGAIIFWYGGIWPRRRDRMLPEKKTSP